MGKVIDYAKIPTAVPFRGLTEQECEAVKAATGTLIDRGRATGSAIHHDSRYMCVFDTSGEPYLVGRQNGVCYLFDKYNMILARSEQFEIVLDALKMMLAPAPEEAD
jgi:hypothetical protein